MCTTTHDAYEMATMLCQEYNYRKEKEKKMNIRKDELKAKEDKAAEKGEGPSRTVTEIDYRKHEDTVRELKRQEKDEEFARKKVEASQWCTLDHEHGPQCRRQVGGCSHDHQKEWQIYEKSTEEKIGAADRFRLEGNEAYKKQNYGLAAVHYRKALLQFDYTFAEGEEEEKACENVKVPCLLNLAACKSHQEEWDEVLTQCRLALEINPRAVKAYYRIGIAHLARDHFDLAKDALMSANEIEPQNQEVLQALRQLKTKKENYKVRTKEVYKEMMSGREANDDGDKEANPEKVEPDASEIPPPPAPHVADRPEPPAPAPPVDDTSVSAVVLADSSSSSPTIKVSRDEGVVDAEAAPENSGSTLRQRRVANPPKQDLQSDPGSDDDDTSSVALPPKALNYILFAAAGLGLCSVLVCIAAFLTVEA